ncbi:ABC transporter ATP-binding protein [Aurantibacillus circumpalustris]|uniref:ABC transporter ATP-binding protein n=1 Tax=Aurantibacillus circumpalustris TaxID=3036359 RepID=UPI00295B7550|nr:ABC transporter ATP-binding protein [Aurantibacillus circumpalustris]
MPKLFAVLKYIKGYWNYASLNIGFNILYSIFSVISISLVFPFLKLLNANYAELLVLYNKPEPKFSILKLTGYLLDSFNYQITNIIFRLGTDESELAAGKIKALLFICLVVFTMTFFKNLFRYLAMFFIAPIRNGVVRDLRNKLHKKSLNLPLSYYSDEKKGDLISRITNDVVEIEFGIMTSLEVIFREPLTITMFLGAMIAISPALTLYVFLLLPFAAIFIIIIGKSLKRSSQKSKETLGHLFSILDETLGGIKIIKAFTGERFIQQKFESINQTYYKQALSVYRKTDLSSPLTESVVVGVLMVILFIGGSMVINGTGGLDAETFILYFAAASQIIPPIKQITVAYGFIQKGVASEERIDKILNAPLVIENSVDAKELKLFNEKIEFRNVSFAYRKGDSGYVLKDIYLTIKKGQTIALVGQSGSGKTTLADMIPRFYDTDNGLLLIDDTNIKQLTIESIRNQIGIVSQESILFNDTVFNNIAFGLQNIKETDVIEAAKIANAHEFIEKLPQGYHTNIGDRGGKLSGGQKQRLSIARAILKDPSILILDEATSALDTESERLVQDALSNLMKNRTSIVIAHRLSTIANADEIIVMHKGEIIERGNHAELIALDGTYKKLCDMQSFK